MLWHLEGGQLHCKHVWRHNFNMFHYSTMLQMTNVEYWLVSYMVTRPPLLNPSDVTWRHLEVLATSGVTLAQAMTWCRHSPSHYLSQCWLTKRVHRHSFTFGQISKCPWNSSISLYLEFTLFKTVPHFPGSNGFTSTNRWMANVLDTWPIRNANESLHGILSLYQSFCFWTRHFPG